MSAISGLIIDSVTNVVNANSDSIEQELRDSTEGKLTVSLPVKLTLVGSRVYLTASLAYSRKFTDEVEAMLELEDPSQPKLPIR